MIESLAKHYRRDECAHLPAEEKRVRVDMLEWVLGDAEHRSNYEKGIGVLADIANDPESSADILRFALKTALRFLE